MTKIQLYIDTEDSASHDRTDTFLPRSPHKVGLLSSIPITQAQREGFEEGFGVLNLVKMDDLTYVPAKIRDAKKKLKNDHRCNVLAVTGGLATFNAIKGQRDIPFVCLVGEIPAAADLISSNCFGGISTEAFKSNKARAQHIAARAACHLNEVGLYYNPNSGVQAKELADWKTFNPANTAIPFSGATDGATPQNVDTFVADFAGLDAGLKAIVISADPFFTANMEKLIPEANRWGGYVCYPLQDYINPDGTTPETGKSTLFGPDLTAAYAALGFLARNAAVEKNLGFFILSNSILDR